MMTYFVMGIAIGLIIVSWKLGGLLGKVESLQEQIEWMRWERKI